MKYIGTKRVLDLVAGDIYRLITYNHRRFFKVVNIISHDFTSDMVWLNVIEIDSKTGSTIGDAYKTCLNISDPYYNYEQVSLFTI